MYLGFWTLRSTIFFVSLQKEVTIDHGQASLSCPGLWSVNFPGTGSHMMINHGGVHLRDEGNEYVAGVWVDNSQ